MLKPAPRRGGEGARIISDSPGKVKTYMAVAFLPCGACRPCRDGSILIEAANRHTVAVYRANDYKFRIMCLEV